MRHSCHRGDPPRNSSYRCSGTRTERGWKVEKVEYCCCSYTLQEVITIAYGGTAARQDPSREEAPVPGQPTNIQREVGTIANVLDMNYGRCYERFGDPKNNKQAAASIGTSAYQPRTLSAEVAEHQQLRRFLGVLRAIHGSPRQASTMTTCKPATHRYPFCLVVVRYKRGSSAR